MSKIQDNEEGIALTSVGNDRDALEYNDNDLDENIETYVHKELALNGAVLEDGFLTKCLSPFVNMIVFLQYHWVYSRLEFILGAIATLLILMLTTGLVERLEGPKSSLNGLFTYHHDIENVPQWTKISSKLDLKRDMIDHWCLDGTNSNCDCGDPFIPEPKKLNDDWVRASKWNRKQVKKAVEKKFETEYSHVDEEEEDEKNHTFKEETIVSKYRTVDVVFLGDSMTEQRTGRVMGKKSEDLKGIKKVFGKKFQSNETDIVGMALGIAGDTSNNLLWRIMKGKEVHMNMDPKAFWVTIGINDLMNTMCSEEVTLVGIINIVEELRQKKPNSYVVINSLLPVKTGKDLLERDGKAYGAWRSLSNINEVLHKFAKHTKKVKFFDATKVFTEKKDDGNLYVKSDLFSDLVHPNKKGQKLWIDAQYEFLKKLIKPLPIDESGETSGTDETNGEFEHDDSYYPSESTDFDFNPMGSN
jgi:lysophospholipase L1-like esterase